MCSYFAPNGVSSCGSKALLEETVRQTWKRPDAVIMTDCSAVANMAKNAMNLSDEGAAALEAGVDVYGGWNDDLWGDGTLAKALGDNLTTLAALDAAVARTTRQKLELGLLDAATPWDDLGVDDVNASESRASAYDLALQSLVLLRNDGGGTLPLDATKNVAVVGPLAADGLLLRSDYANSYEGALAYAPSLLDAVRGFAPSATYAAGCDVDGADDSRIAAAAAAAAAADAVILAVGTTHAQEHEALDRSDTLLPGVQEKLALAVLAAAAEASVSVVIVLCNGGIVSVDALLTTDATIAVVEAFSPQSQGADALAALVFGRENRWGKLPVTVYGKDYAATTRITDMDFRNRSYRYYEGAPLFAFGDGLSYTSFAHACACSSNVACACNVTNTGKRAGDEVLMVFHRLSAPLRAAVLREHPVPLKQLVDFERVALEPGASARVAFEAIDASLTTADGSRRVYAGGHELVFSRGNGRDVVIPVTV
ncbi:xylan 1,4-beta-xylosidase [Aureococcus anophagefferens]|uniref:Xylan 1,4-beta-xylosidase n=1 Tax=Aureococcus anophagefferens TaxID=44056 RepID=A0ABR1G5W2_AURAN